MLEGGTHGTLLCSGGDFEAISGCGAPLSAPPPKYEGRLCGCALGVGGWNTRLLLNIGTIKIACVHTLHSAVDTDHNDNQQNPYQ